LQESRRRNLTLSRVLFAGAVLAVALTLALTRGPAPRAAEQKPRPADGPAPGTSSGPPPPPEAQGRAVQAENEVDPPEPPSFPRDVMTTLGRYCEKCHGAQIQQAGLRLDGYDGLMRGGEHGRVIIPGDPQRSLLVAKIEHRSRPSMPPRRKLPPAAVAKIRAWVLAGAQP
jgi:hypothetical protein